MNLSHPDAPWTTHYCSTCGQEFSTQMNRTVKVNCTRGHGVMEILEDEEPQEESDSPSTHEVSVNFTIQMEDMDGDAGSSAEVFFDVYSNDVRKAIEDACGSPVVHFEVTEPSN